jgi:hypothetical protein
MFSHQLTDLKLVAEGCDMRNAIALIAAGVMTLGAAAPAQAALGVQCANSDITPTATKCAGFVLGNAVGGQDTSPTNAALLAELGYTGSLAGIELIENLGGATNINFNTLLVGQTIIGVHYGNGQGSPGRPAGSQGDGGDTAFYLFNAGAGLDTFTLNFNSSSNVRLYQTGVAAVPEAGTWAMMLIGFGAIGASMRRRRGTNVSAQIA